MNALPLQRLTDTTFAVIDVETTGFNPMSDAVVEAACVLTRARHEIRTFSTLIHPGRPIPANASAIHHLTDADVADAPTLAEVAPQLRALCADAVVVAHNARFDLGFLPHLADRPVICSMRFAQRVLPDAPNYKNQGLREYLGVCDARVDPSAAHRALADAIITSLVFRHCLECYLTSGRPDDVNALMAELNAPIALRSFTFGRYRNRPLDIIPSDYLTWLLTKATGVSEDARHTAQVEIDRRRDRADTTLTATLAST